MSGALIRVDDAAVLSVFSRLETLMRDPAPMLKSMGEYLLPSTRDRFATEASPQGVPWEPLIPDYAAAKKGPGILRESGALLRSMRYQVVGASLMVGTDSIYGAIHQFGGEIVPRKAGALVFHIAGRKIVTQKVEIPARPWLGLSVADREELVAIGEDEIGLIIDGR